MFYSLSTSQKANFFLPTGEGSIPSPANIPSISPSTNQKPIPSISPQVIIQFSHFFTTEILPNLNKAVDLFSGGQIKFFLTQLEALTSDQTILRIVRGDPIEFIGVPPSCSFCPQNSISKEHETMIDEEISKLEAKSVIVKTSHESGEFISPIFSVPKKDNKVRLILNLKKFTEHVKSYYFKMDSIHIPPCH